MNVQELMQSELLEEETQDSNETLELLKFFKNNGVALSTDQVKAMMLLNENGLGDLSKQVNDYRQVMTPKKTFYGLIDKLTMADRIKGNAKLSHLMKASANPAQTALKPEDVQAKGMSQKELK